MGFDLSIFEDEQLKADYIEWLVDERSIDAQTHFTKLWEYYKNPMAEVVKIGGSVRKVNESGRCYVQAQECGLPPRITGLAYSANTGVFGGQQVRDVQRKEVVIENDIAWRINATVEFLFGKPISFVSKSPVSQKRAKIEAILKAVFGANGAVGFFQDMAVLGSVYGFVDCLIRPGDDIASSISCSSKTHSFEDVLQLAQTIGLELIEAPRALPVLEEGDYKKIRYYVQHFYQKRNALRQRHSFLAKLLPASRRSPDASGRLVVAGVLKNKLGNLTSAVALRLTFMGMLSKNERKRFTYTEGLKKIAQMVLAMLDRANIYKTSEADREIDIIFPSPLPENMMEKLKEAQIKKELGVPTEQVLRELGYDTMNERENSNTTLRSSNAT